jgi:sporulation protein YlmC with PRC-barrel domain
MRDLFMAILAVACVLSFAATSLAQDHGQSQMGSTEDQGTASARQNPSGQPPPATAPHQQQAQPPQEQYPYAGQLMDPDRFKDLPLYDAQGEEIGSIDQVVLDASEGRIGYIVVSSGGLFGVGGEKSIIPWGALRFQQSAEQEEPRLVVHVPRERLLSAPHGDAQDIDRNYARLIHEYYGVSPYWEEAQEEQAEQPPRPQQPLQPR